GGAEPRVRPGARPHRRVLGGDLRVVVRFLVRNQGPPSGVRAVDAGFPARLPEHLVAAEEREADAGIACRLDIRPLLTRPVLVVTARDEDLVVLEQRTSTVD